MRKALVLVTVMLCITGCDRKFIADPIPKDYGQEIDDLLSRIETVEGQLQLLNGLVVSLSNDVNTVTSLIGVLEAQLLTADTALETQLQSAIDSLTVTVNDNESQVTSLIIRIASLEANNGLTVNTVIDPCGNSPGLDEVLLKMSDGSILAWLKNTGLVELSNGVYITTDKQKCNFTVLNGVVSF